MINNFLLSSMNIIYYNIIYIENSFFILKIIYSNNFLNQEI